MKKENKTSVGLPEASEDADGDGRGVSSRQPSLLSHSPENPKQTDTPNPAWGVCSGSVWVAESLMKPHCADQGPREQPQPCPRGPETHPAAGSELGGAKEPQLQPSWGTLGSGQGPGTPLASPAPAQNQMVTRQTTPAANGPPRPRRHRPSLGKGWSGAQGHLWLLPPRSKTSGGCSLLRFCYTTASGALAAF